MAKVKSNRDKIIEDMRNLLGDGMVDVELDPDHYNVAVDKAITRYRMRSSNSMEYAGLFVKFTAGQQTTLPIWMLSELIRPRQSPITNVVAVFIICITFIPILYASYITRNTTEVEGSSK